jgi:hypothetical protein
LDRLKRSRDSTAENTKTALTDPTSAADMDDLAPSLRGRRILFTAPVAGAVLETCGLMVATLSRGDSAC